MPIQSFRQSSIVSALTVRGLNTFSRNFAHVSYLPMSAKSYSEFF